MQYLSKCTYSFHHCRLLFIFLTEIREGKNLILLTEKYQEEILFYFLINFIVECVNVERK